MRTSPLTEFVAALSHEDRHAIIRSYEQFEEAGFIGDAPIRIFARKFIEQLGIGGDSHITLWMDQLAKECYRYYYHVVYGAQS